MKTVLITGASTGIGRATTEVLAGKGWRVFAGIRKQEDADALSKLDGDIRPVRLDVTDQGEIDAVYQEIDAALAGHKLSGLVNNAGVAFMGPLALQSVDEFRMHMDVNVLGTLQVTRAMIPLLGMDQSRLGEAGRIVNITSVGGRISSPFLGAYTASKHAIESLTDTFRRELVLFGIDAIAVGPGSVRTPIWDKAEEKNTGGPYAGTPWATSLDQFADTMMEGGKNGFAPEKIGEVVYTALSADKPKARYAPVPDKLTNWTIPTRLPKRWLDAIFWRRFGMTPKSKQD